MATGGPVGHPGGDTANRPSHPLQYSTLPMMKFLDIYFLEFLGGRLSLWGSPEKLLKGAM